MRVPTPRLIALMAAGLPLALLPALGFVHFWPLVPTWLGVTLLLLLADAVLMARAADFAVAIRAPATLYLGESDPLEVDVTLARPELARSLFLQVEVAGPVAPLPGTPIGLDPHGRATAGFTLKPLERGRVRIESAWLRWAGPLRLLRGQVRMALDRAIPAVPNVRAVRGVALQMRLSSSRLAGRKPERFDGDGSEFESLREFAPGLDARSLDWKSSARHLKLLSRQFRAERNHSVVLALDTGARMREPIDGVSRLDRAINAALLLAFVALKTGDKVGLFGFDAVVRLQEVPAAGMPVFARLQRRVAELDAAPAATNYTLGLTALLERLRRRALVILFTDFADPISAELMVENLARLVRRHVVLFVALRDPELDRVIFAEPTTAVRLHQAVIAAELERDRGAVLQQVERLGVHVQDVRAEEVSTRLVNRYLEIKRRELVA